MQTVAAKNPTLSRETSVTYDVPPSAIIQDLEQNITDAFPKPANVTTRIKYVPDALEPYLSPAFYMIPSIDNTSENIIYINQAHTMEDIRLFTTLAHEGYPGHLYQTTYYANTNPDPLRNLLNFSGYVEGWATYAEMCSYYVGYVEILDLKKASLKKKKEKFSQKKFHKSILDIGPAPFDVVEKWL